MIARMSPRLIRLGPPGKSAGYDFAWDGERSSRAFAGAGSGTGIETQLAPGGPTGWATARRSPLPIRGSGPWTERPVPSRGAWYGYERWLGCARPSHPASGRSQFSNPVQEGHRTRVPGSVAPVRRGNRPRRSAARRRHRTRPRAAPEPDGAPVRLQAGAPRVVQPDSGEPRPCLCAAAMFRTPWPATLRSLQQVSIGAENVPVRRLPREGSGASRSGRSTGTVVPRNTPARPVHRPARVPEPHE
jgi:hypothetical protein